MAVFVNISKLCLYIYIYIMLQTRGIVRIIVTYVKCQRVCYGIYVCVYMYVWVCVCGCMLLYGKIFHWTQLWSAGGEEKKCDYMMHAHTHTHTHTYIHSYTHTHVHTWCAHRQTIQWYSDLIPISLNILLT